jgi:Fe-S cluster biogenesis protein NfuA
MSLIRNLFRRSELDPASQGPLYPQVRSAMSDVQAYARSHGGEIELLGVTEEGDVTVRMAGACRGCPMSSLTLKHGIEEQLKVLVPGVRKIIEAK